MRGVLASALLAVTLAYGSAAGAQTHTPGPVATAAPFDASYTDHVVLIADSKDGGPLGTAGPYRLIVPFEKREARWVRNITDVHFVHAPNF